MTGYALRRDVKGKEQRVFVLGDADCISNGSSEQIESSVARIMHLRMECFVGCLR